MIDAESIPRAHTVADRSNRARALRWGGPILVVALFLISGLSTTAGSPMALPPAAQHAPIVGHALPGGGAASHVAPPSAAPRSGGGGGSNVTYVENGTGTFFNNTAVPNATTGHASCGIYRSYSYSFKYCWNATLDPTVNVTTNGVTGMAYTVWTNDSVCPGMAINATTEIGFVTSTNFGQSWGTPEILGNPICVTDTQNDSHYANAEMPSLTSLANGTFVLSYIESNISAAHYYYYDAAYPFSIGCYYTDYDRVVVSESYDNGSTWTSPTVIQQTDISYSTSYGCANPGTGLLRPSITATGNTIYLAYTEMPYYFEDCCNYSVNYESYLHLVVSTNGGATWTNASVPPTFIEFSTYPAAAIAAYPSVMVTPSGELYMAYITGDAYNFVCSVYCTDLYNSSVVVAWSSDNGTTFNYSVVTQTAYFPTYQNYGSDFLSGLYPEMAYSQATGQLFVTYTSTVFGEYCEYYSGGSYCGYVTSLDDVFFSNSSDGGATWSSPKSIDPWFINTNLGPANSAYLPSVATLPDGQVDLTYSTVNDTECVSYYCGASQQFFIYSRDNGTTWSQPALVYNDWNTSECATCTNGMSMYIGEQSSITIAGGQVLLAWGHLDNGIYGYAFWGYYGAMNVETSRLFTGQGVTLSFTESGLPSGAVWHLTVGGYGRNGPAGTTLSLSGVPPAGSISYNVAWVNTSYGIAWEPTVIPASPSSFSTNSTITVTYSEIFLVNVLTLPALQSYYWQYGYVNYQVGPLPGPYWLPGGTSFSLYINATTPAFCYPCLNLSWVTWVGTGNGSYTGPSTATSFTVSAPTNETATFTMNGYCYTYLSPPCRNYTYSQAFIESGLPGGTDWGVSLGNPNGTITSLSSTTSMILQNISNGVTTFTAWTVPSATAGEYWVPSSTSPSAFTEPNPPILITYTLETVSNEAVSSWVTETGLPNATAWTFQVGSYASGSTAATQQIQAFAGSSEVLNASAVYFEDGTGYYVKSISVMPLVVNSTSYTVTPGGSTTIYGPAVISYTFDPMYLVTSTASVGGTVSAASQWVDSGTTISLTATPSAGYHFVSWTGTGSGSTSSGTTTTITVKPTAGPVTEFATFRKDFPPTWNVTFVASGLPAGTSFSIVVGGTTYSSPTSITIGQFATGNYTISAPTIYANASNTTQFLPISLTSSAGLSAGVLDLTQNVTLTVTYETQYALSVFATPGGSITGYPNGLYWVTAGSSVDLTASPSSGYQFAGWSGTVSSSSASITVPVNGVSNETAQFLVRPIPPPAVYALTVVETGLPANTPWAVSAGASGISGTSSSLVIAGLNGSYPITAATLFPATGIRWVSNVTNVSASVTSNRSITVNYWEQFQVSVSATAGGSASDGVTGSWVNASQTITLIATANSTSEFLSWNGTGTGAYSGTSASTTVTVTGPISEQATFGPLPSTPTGKQSNNNANNNGLTMTVLVFVALLVAGLVVGLLVGRRRSPPAASYEAPAGSETAPAETEAAPMEEPAPAIYDEGTPPS